MGGDGYVWMFEYEAYIKEKRLEGHGLWKDEIYLRKAYRRAEAEQRRERRSGEGIMNHLYFMQMSWWQHAKGAWSLSWKLFLLSLSAAVHGLLPFMFLSTTSDGVKKIANDLDTRNDT